MSTSHTFMSSPKIDIDCLSFPSDSYISMTKLTEWHNTCAWTTPWVRSTRGDFEIWWKSKKLMRAVTINCEFSLPWLTQWIIVTLWSYSYIATVNILTNGEESAQWRCSSSKVGDHTPIVACITGLDSSEFQLCSHHLKCAIFTREIQPLIHLTLLSKPFPLPLVVQFSSSGLDWECNCLPWKNVLLAFGLWHNCGRLGWKK